MSEPPEPEDLPDWMKEGQEAEAQAEDDPRTVEADKSKSKKRRRKEEGGTSFQEIEGVAEGEEDEISAEALTASVWQPPPPWKLSLYTSLTGAALIVLLLLLPSWRGVTLGGSYYPTPYFIFVIIALTAFWAVYGLAKEEYLLDRLRSLMGLGIAAITVILIFVAVRTDPYLKAAEESRQEIETRQDMSPEELRQWREQRLKRFQR